MEMKQIGENLKRIEQIDQIAKNTLNRHHQKMPQKYANIQATLKLLSNLIANFRKRAQNYENQLKNRAKINDLMDQIKFHRERITDCERMSEALEAKVQDKKTIIVAQQVKVKELRAELLRLKTDNVKKVLTLENLQAKRRNVLNRETTEIRRTNWKRKTELSRAQHTNYTSGEDELTKEKNKVVKALHAALKQKKTIETFIEEAWQLAKVKLYKNEKKANQNGLNGSLMFRILENDHPCPPKPLNDKKLMIYDVLKSKYKVHRKEENRQKITVTQEDFMKYSPMQVFGLVELKGGLPTLLEAISQFEKQQEAKELISDIENDRS